MRKKKEEKKEEKEFEKGDKKIISKLDCLTFVHLHNLTALCVPMIRYPSLVSALLCSLVTISRPPSRAAKRSAASFSFFSLLFCLFIAAPMSSKSRRSLTYNTVQYSAVQCGTDTF